MIQHSPLFSFFFLNCGALYVDPNRWIFKKLKHDLHVNFDLLILHGSREKKKKTRPIRFEILVFMGIVIRILRFVFRILRKMLHIYATNPIYSWILGFRCESYISIYVLSNLTIQAIWLSENSYNHYINIKNLLPFFFFCSFFLWAFLLLKVI